MSKPGAAELSPERLQTVPTVLGEEVEYNPFMRAPELLKRLDGRKYPLAGGTAEMLRLLRQAKDEGTGAQLGARL